MIYLIEMDCAVDAAGTVQTLRFASQGYVTQPTDNPPNAYYEPRLRQTGTLGRTMYSDATTMGRSKVGIGELELVNTDGALDTLGNYGYDWREFRLLTVAPGQPYASAVLALRGVMEQPELSYKTLTVILHDRLAELDDVLCKHRYGGTNVLPNGEDGTADIAGKAVPRLYGTVFNIAPVLVNTSKLIYQVHDGAIASIPNVYDAGLALARGADYSSVADMEANAPTAGQYRVYLAGGYFRLGSSASGQLTCDAQAGTPAQRTCAQILKQIALDMGVASADINAASVAALDALNSAECGIWIADDTHAITAMDNVAQSIGASFGFDRLGTFTVSRLDVPAGAPMMTLDASSIIDIDRERSNDANKGIPSYRMVLTYSKNYTIQTSGIAGSVTDARRAVIGAASQQVIAEDASVKLKHLSSPAMTRDTCLAWQADAAAEAARLLAIYKVRRDTYQAKIRLDATALTALDLGVCIAVQFPRFGMQGARLLRVLGIESDYASNTATLTLWG